ncbi:MAG TPA: peptide deformylase [Byssovorax sp.]
MSLYKIAQIGHPVLRQRARELEPEEILRPPFQRFLDDLVETMRDANGAGLAAIQVYRPIRVVAVEVTGNNPRYPYKPPIPLQILINPVITPLTDEVFENFEGCLSVPGLRGLVERRAEVHVSGLDREGNPIEFDARGLKAGTYQHECDHLDGVLFTDRVKDPKTLCTLEAFERYHQKAFVERIRPFIQRMGS